MNGHSPLPWWKEVDPKGRLFGDGSPLYLVKCSRGIVAEIVGGEEADLIIHAVNSHCELLAALRALAEPDMATAPYLHQAWLNTAKRAIAKATDGNES